MQGPCQSSLYRYNVTIRPSAGKGSFEMVYIVGAWRGGEAEISVGRGVELRGLGWVVGVRNEE